MIRSNGAYMAYKKRTGLTKTDIEKILSIYRLQKNEFRRIEGFEKETYESIRLKGYMVSFSEERVLPNRKTGRVIVTHTRANGKISLYDIWERDGNGELQFRFRNPRDIPLADRDYIRESEEENKRLKGTGQKLQETLLLPDTSDKSIIDHRSNNENPTEIQKLQTEILGLKKELDISHKLIIESKRELDRLRTRLENPPIHNARGAGRKPSKDRADAVKRCRALLAQGKSSAEIQDILGISSATFYRYKRSLDP